MTRGRTSFRVGDIIRTPFEPSGCAKIVEMYDADGKTCVKVEYVEDHPHGYAKGTQGLYYTSDWRRSTP